MAGTKLAAIREACGELRSAVGYLRSALRPGLTERQVANRLRNFFRSRGYRTWAFRFIIAAGPSAAEPHHVPTGRRLRPGDMVICDFGLRIRDVASDMSRTFVLGRPTARMRQVYRAVLNAQRLAATALKPGITGRAIDAIARAELTKQGLGKTFIHGTGHGVGYKIHQPPWLSRRGHTALKSGGIVTVEPGVYIKRWGGIRIEDMYLITAKGAKHLSTVPRRLKDAIIPL